VDPDRKQQHKGRESEDAGKAKRVTQDEDAKGKAPKKVATRKRDLSPSDSSSYYSADSESDSRSSSRKPSHPGWKQVASRAPSNKRSRRNSGPA
jgi:hypothetical protein